jgi:PTH1 family peptidyl-tRNA hydrolase
MRVVVGLGNPGREYAATRHNVGFMVADRLIRRATGAGNRRRFRSDVTEGTLANERVVIVKPQTYMNLSGHAVREAASWFHLPVQSILIVYDDLDLPFGTLRLRSSGSGGGHNGLRSVIEQMGTTEVPRLRVGIGRGRSPAISQVLSRFTPDEAQAMESIIDNAADAVQCWLQHDLAACMNEYNRTATDIDQANSR